MPLSSAARHVSDTRGAETKTKCLRSSRLAKNIFVAISHVSRLEETRLNGVYADDGDQVNVYRAAAR